MRRTSIWLALLLLLLAASAFAQDEEQEEVPYFQSPAFNAPIIIGWDDQSTAHIAQFEQAQSRAIIRTALVAESAPAAAAAADLAALLGAAAPPPVYSGKVNLADGTWHTLVYEIDAATTASVMARQAGDQAVVISFVESDPATRAVMLTLAQADDTAAEATAEIAVALETLAGASLSGLPAAGTVTLPSGDWLTYGDAELAAMGMVFGNDSYIALQTGAGSDLAALQILADAWNRTVLGFFITPDNSPYLALGLAVTFVILGALIFSFYWRSRGLRQDLALLEELAQPAD